MLSSKFFLLVFSPLGIALFLAFAGGTTAASEKSPVSVVNTAEGVVLKGYDPVAYFTIGRPTAGVPEYSFTTRFYDPCSSILDRCTSKT